ncbi:MAG: hypothetical protein Ct9H90mP15_02580 [Candidatus Neomarinimicrobiota bacterium]|nr:MAG: hypothetical protein Ct9H90mP15_02580 [Candidatus Neomarinimicrobiota bacterium]
MITLLSPSKKLNLNSQEIVDHYTNASLLKALKY